MADDLRALAEAATPGKWWTEKGADGCVYAYLPGGRPNGEGLLEVRYHGREHNATANAAFIAAANPTAILALLAQLDCYKRLEAAVLDAIISEAADLATAPGAPKGESIKRISLTTEILEGLKAVKGSSAALLALGEPLRVLVCGGRNYVEEWNVFYALERLWEDHGMKLVVIEGGARGADEAAAVWADSWRHRQVAHLQFKANWREHGKSAGPRRNQRMLDEGKPDLVLAFPGGVGTADMVKRATKAGIEVRHAMEGEVRRSKSSDSGGLGEP